MLEENVEEKNKPQGECSELSPHNWVAMKKRTLIVLNAPFGLVGMIYCSFCGIKQEEFSGRDYCKITSINMAIDKGTFNDEFLEKYPSYEDLPYTS
jgi:hypothetical protein